LIDCFIDSCIIW